MRNGMLEFKDAPMFGRVMRDPEICIGVLERILGIEIARVEYLNTEQTFDPATDAKGIRLDVFTKADGRVFDIEMQVPYEPALGRRMRYYQASIDQACLDKGAAYDGLCESYVIFICDYDPYGRGLPAYHLERSCEEEPLVVVGDHSHWLVLNASAWEADADHGRAALLNYVHTNAKADDGLIRRIEASVEQANDDERWREDAVGFMTLEHSHRAQLSAATRLGVEEGLRRGVEQGEARYAALVDLLLEQKRFDDLKRSADDAAYRQSLYEEFDLG